MMLLWVRPTPLRSRLSRSAAGKPLPRTSPARSQVPTKTSGSRFTIAFLRAVDPGGTSEALAPPRARQYGPKDAAPGAAGRSSPGQRKFLTQVHVPGVYRLEQL